MYFYIFILNVAKICFQVLSVYFGNAKGVDKKGKV